tara:strand:+ start:879 stop:1799 length:921 start_codon:yes stop_codon:yes gene_type:complete
MNTPITDNLKHLITTLETENNSNNKFKIISFRKAINIISNLDFKIESSEQLKDIKGIGDGIKKRIDEIISSGVLKEIKVNTSTIDELNKLKEITGIGPSKAKKLLEKNITFDKLMNNPSAKILSELTHHQQLGIKFFNDLQKKIPRSVIIEVESFLKKFGFDFTICGSYRRGKEESGDIDILIKENIKTTNLSDIINILTKKKFLVEHLTTLGSTKYMGICKLPNFPQFMRIDIRLIRPESYVYAILYFTGSKKNNTYMRNKAIKLGYKLNEYGLYNNSNNKSISLNTEEQVYEYLKLPYIVPTKR